MSWENVPWFVGGGAEHSPEVMRLALYASTGGAEGIVAPRDLRVRPLTVPGLGVRIDTGSALLLNRSPGASQQTYAVRKPVQETVGDDLLSATGGSARSDLVVVRVEDPQYAPWQDPPDPQHGPYVFTHVIEGVPSDTLTAAELNLGYPAIALARIDRPASTGTIEAQHIVDLRRVALPRKERHVRAYQLLIADQQSLHTGSVTFPDIAYLDVVVPEWATVMQVVATWGTLKGTGVAHGVCYVRMESGANSIETQHSGWEAEEGNTRFTITMGDDRNLPAAFRGLPARIRLMANKSAGPNVYADGYSSVVLDVEFSEAATVD